MPGLKRDIDTEFLHDFRVSVRRTRSCLGHIKRVFPPGEVEEFRKEFAWLGSLTGPTRDMDVYLLKMSDYRLTLPEPVQRDLRPLEEFLARLRKVKRLAVDTETMGLQTIRDRLCLVQLCNRDVRAAIVQIPRESLSPDRPPAERGLGTDHDAPLDRVEVHDVERLAGG